MSGDGSAGRSGAALGVGALAGALVAVPALSRVAESGAGRGLGFLVLAGGSALLLGPVLAMMGRARARGTRLRPIVAGLALSAWPVARLGSLLESTTHHRPLGAATFALVALALVLGCLLVARRVSSVEPSDRGLGRVLVAALYAAALVSVGLVLLAALRADSVRPHVVDAGSLVVGGALGWDALRRSVVVRALARVGPLLWITLLAAHLAATRTEAFHQIRDRAPVLSGPAAWP